MLRCKYQTEEGQCLSNNARFIPADQNDLCMIHEATCLQTRVAFIRRLQATVEERPEDSDYDRASISLAQDAFYARHEGPDAAPR